VVYTSGQERAAALGSKRFASNAFDAFEPNIGYTYGRDKANFSRLRAVLYVIAKLEDIDIQTHPFRWRLCNTMTMQFMPLYFYFMSLFDVAAAAAPALAVAWVDAAASRCSKFLA
jgi:hypothetical protein